MGFKLFRKVYWDVCFRNLRQRKTRSSLCVRDRVGVKPFFYYWDEGLFLFGSELKAFHQHPSFQKEINLDAVAAFMQYGNVPTNHCIFQNCSKLKPGHYLLFDLKTKKHNSQLLLECLRCLQ